MEKYREKIVITGFTSKISSILIKKLKKKKLKIFKCGRGIKSDLRVDFSNLDGISNFVKFIKKIKPNYLLLCHGTLVGKKLKKYSLDNIKKTIFVNLVSNILILEELENSKNLNTVLISSISGKLGSYDNLYAATKAGLDLVAKSISRKMQKSSRLNLVSPGIIKDSKMTTIRKDKNVLLKKKFLTPTKQFTSSKEVADIIEYLLFNSKNIHGENININGGLY